MEQTRKQRIECDARWLRMLALGAIGGPLASRIAAKHDWRYLATQASGLTREAYEHLLERRKPLSDVTGYWGGVWFCARRADLLKLWRADSKRVMA